MKIRNARVRTMVKLDVDKNNPEYIAVIFRWKGGGYLRNFNVLDEDDVTRLNKLMEWSGISKLADLRGKEFTVLCSIRTNFGGIGPSMNMLYGEKKRQYITENPHSVCMRENEILKLYQA